MKIFILQVHRVHQENEDPLGSQGQRVRVDKQERRDLVAVEVVQEHREKTALQVERVLEENQERTQTLMLPCFKTLSNNCKCPIKQVKECLVRKKIKKKYFIQIQINHDIICMLLHLY